MDGARDSDVEFLSDTVLVPADIGEDVCIFRNDFLDILQDALRGHREAAVVGDRFVGLLEVRLCLCDRCAELRIGLALRADLLHFFKDLLQSDLQISNCADLYRIVAADLGRLNIDLDELGVCRSEGNALVPGGAVSLCKTGAQAEDHVRVVGQGVSELKAPETGLSDKKRMKVRDAALAGPSAYRSGPGPDGRTQQDGMPCP